MRAIQDTSEFNTLLGQKRPNRIGQISDIIAHFAYGAAPEIPEKIVSRLLNQLKESKDGLLARLRDELEAQLPMLVQQELGLLERNPYHTVSLEMRDVVKALLWLRQQAS